MKDGAPGLGEDDGARRVFAFDHPQRSMSASHTAVLGYVIKPIRLGSGQTAGVQAGSRVCSSWQPTGGLDGRACKSMTVDRW